MNIRFLQTAVRLAHNHSFRLTAESLNTTQAAISSRIAAMEQELGVRLFDRQTRGVVLTIEGQEFVDGASAIVQQYEALTARLRPSPEIKGVVRLGLVSSMAQVLLPDIAHTLHEKHPGVNFEVTTDSAVTLQKLLDDNKLDVCVTTELVSPSERHEVVPLLRIGMFWVASPHLIPASHERYSIMDLVRFPLISYAPGTLNSERLMRYLGNDGRTEFTIHSSNSLATSIHMTVNSIGITVVPAVVLQRELREGLLHVLNLDPPFMPTDYVITYSRLRDTRYTARLVHIVQAAAQRLCMRFDPSLARLLPEVSMAVEGF